MYRKIISFYFMAILAFAFTGSVLAQIQYANLATSCKQIRISNTGRLGGMSLDNSFQYINDCDTFGSADGLSYLFDASPVIAWYDGEYKLCTDIHSDSDDDPRSFIALSNLEIDETSYPDYVYATGDFTTFDSSINITVDYYIPKGDTACEFVIQKLYVTSASGAKNNVALGYTWDWNVPSDSGSDNTSFADAQRTLLYLTGEEADDDGEAEALAECGIEQQSNDRFAGVRFMPTGNYKVIMNAMTLDNNTWMYSTGPYGDDAPLPTGPTYDLMLTKVGVFPWVPATPSDDSIYVDLSMLATFGEFDLSEGTQIELAFATITGRTGLDDFYVEFNKAYYWAVNIPEINVRTTCCRFPGDANGDEAYNIGDATFLVSNIFKGGPLPDCLSAGDANTDNGINIGDIVFTISYVFRGGREPYPCGTSMLD